MARGPRFLRQFLSGVTLEEVQRFDGALHVTRTELGRRCENGSGPWIGSARAEVANADNFRDAYKLEAGWTALKAAEREMIQSFGVEELAAEARIARHEADGKLTGWRRASVADLLPDVFLDRVDAATPTDVSTVVELPSGAEHDDDPANEATARAPSTPTGANPPGAEALVDQLRTRVIKVKRLVDTHSDNTYHKFRILRRAVIITSVSLAVVLAVLFTVVALEWVPNDLLAANSPLGGWKNLLVVMCLGAIGAYLSSATQLAKNDDAPGIPELRVRYTLMGMRPVVGAAGAIVVIVVLQSALGEAVILEPTAILGVSIAAGFTERLVTRTVTSAAEAVGG